MDDWQPDWFRAFESIANDITHEVGHLFEEISREISETTDTLVQLSEEVAEDVGSTLAQIDQTIAPKLDQLDEQIGQWLDPVLQTLFGITATLDRAVEPVTHTVEPWLNQHPVCVGCRNYHGQSYNGNPLVCAMHPYGVEEGVETCADKELVSWNFPNFESNFESNFGSNSESDDDRF